MRKYLYVSYEVMMAVHERMKPRETYDNFMRRLFDLPPSEQGFGRPRIHPFVEKPAAQRSEWYLVGELAIGESIVYPWIVLPNGQSDLEACARINPGCLRMARRARIKVNTQAVGLREGHKMEGLKVTRIA